MTAESKQTIPCAACGEPVYDEYPNAHVRTQRITCPCDEAKHTPGPWEVSTDNAGIVVRDGDEIIVAGMWTFSAPGREGQEEANAAFIAASPMMLDALKACAVEHAEGRLTAGTFADVLAAIDKAEGR